MKKYELTDEYCVLKTGEKLYRIKALKDFGEVKKGELGGFIEKESNLSHEGNCWVKGHFDGEAYVFGNAKISDNATIFFRVIVCGNTVISGNSCVESHVIVYDSTITGNAKVKNCIIKDANISGNAEIQCREFGLEYNGKMYLDIINGSIDEKFKYWIFDGEVNSGIYILTRKGYNSISTDIVLDTTSEIPTVEFDGIKIPLSKINELYDLINYGTKRYSNCIVTFPKK